MSNFSTPRDESLLDPTVPLDVILCTEELRRRPARPPDYATENRALATLAAALVDSKADIHQVLAETIMSVTHCDSSGLSLLTEDDGGLRFYWPAIAGAWKSQTGRETPRNGGPCGVALDRNSSLLFHHFERRYTALRPVVPSAEECLVVPFYIDGVAVGTMWAVMHSDGRRFDAEDERIMTAIGQFAAIAHRTLESLHDLKVQVAAREKAEEALRRMATGAEQQARLIIDSALDAVVAIDAEGMITEWNKQAEKIFGWKRDEAIGRRLSQTVIPERYRVAYEKGLQHFLETGEAAVLNRRVEMTALRRNAQEIPVEVSAAPLRMGELWSFYAFVRDITDRRRAEDALRASEQNLGLIINTIPILAWAAQPDGYAEFFNRHYLDYSGLSPEAAQGWGWTAAVHPDDLSGLAAYWQSMMPIGKPGEYEARLRRFDGVYRWFLFRAQPLRNTSGQIVKWYGTNTDIEDRKRAEEALRASESSLRDSEQSLRVMFDTIPAMVCTLKADWEVEDANQQLLDYFGKTVDELKQWALIGVVHPDDLEGVIARCRHSTETGEPYDIEHRCRRRDGTFRWFQVSGRPLKNPEGQIVRWYVVLIDIEDWKRAQEELRSTHAELAHVTRVMTMGELTASIAHEINQPLAAAVASSDSCAAWLANLPPNVEKARVAADRVVQAVNQASAVIQRIRTMFKKAPASRTPLNMNEVISEALLLIQPEISSQRISLRTQLSDGLPPVSADRVQIAQVILNLAMNGIEAMADSTDGMRALMIRSGRGEGAEIQVSVVDSGTGLDSKTTGRLYDPFFTTKAGGMGMGLSISKSIIEAHGGRLWAAANEPCGAVFHFALPMATTDE